MTAVWDSIVVWLTAQAKKESAVLTDASLAALAKELSPQGLVIAMLLNIPTTTLVNFRLSVHERKTSDEDAFKDMLAYWKNMRASAKDKEKVCMGRHWRQCQNYAWISRTLIGMYFKFG